MKKILSDHKAMTNYITQVGAVSWGLGCAVEGLPGAYAEVSAFRTWVDAQITANGGAVFTC